MELKKAPLAILRRRPRGADEPEALWRRWVRRFTRNKKALFGLAILVLFGLVALLAPVLRPGDPSAFIASPDLAPSGRFPLGTNGNGQDVLQQLIWGARISLVDAFAVGVLTTALSTILGIAAAYVGGRGDDAITVVTNVFLVIPGLPLIVTIAIFLPPGALTIVLVLTFTGWAWPSRIVRGQALSLRRRDFVAAAIVSGERDWRVMVQEILPNMWSVVVANFMGSTIYAIGTEASLEFLGLGNVHQVTWGTMLYWAENHADLLQGAWWTFLPPGFAIAIVAFALALCNFAVDEITNPRLRVLKRLLPRAVRGGWRLWPRASAAGGS
jgi:peptide/nickel transport system permease protein